MPLQNGEGRGYVFRSADIPKLDVDTMKPVEIDDWKEKWKGYMNLSGLRHETEDIKLDVLKQGLASATLRKLKTLKSNVASVEEAIKILMKYADSKKSLIMERKKLFERKQRAGESVIDYGLALTEQMETCSFGTSSSENEAIRDAIKTTVFVVGLQDEQAMEAALALKDPKFSDVVELANAREIAVQDRQHVKKQDGGHDATVARVEKHGKKTGSGTSSNTACPWCAKKTRHTREECPASGVTCRNCQKKGHFAKACRAAAKGGAVHSSNSNKGVAANQLSAHRSQQLTWIEQQQEMLRQQQESLMNARQDDWDDEAEVAHIYKVEVDDNVDEDNIGFEPHIYAIDHQEPQLPQVDEGQGKAPRIVIGCQFKGVEHEVRALPDTGADVSAAGIDFLAKLGASTNDLRKSDLKPRAANGRPMEVYGKIAIKWMWNGKTHKDDVYIIEGTNTVLLSWHTVRAIGLLSESYPKSGGQQCDQEVDALDSGEQEDTTPEGKMANELKQQLLREFKDDVFSDEIRVMEGETFKIHLEEGAKPYAVRAARPVPLPLRGQLLQELQALQSKGIIEPVTAPTEWCSPIVVEEKPRGGVRVCVDLTRLNRYVKREWYTSDPPNVAVATLPPDSQYFATLDAKKGYHQCPLDEGSKDLTTFLTPFGRFRYCRAPFGICSISEHYNRRMDEALQDMEDHRRTVDDILMHNAELRRLYNQVRRLLLRCRERGITLSADKFQFGKRVVKFAGYVITKGQYWLDEAIVKAISQFPAPKSRTKLRAFVGLVNQLANANQNIAKLLTPLRPLMSTKNEYTWLEDHQNHFEMIRKELSKAPVVAYYNTEKPLRLTTDASGEGLGFVLDQLQTDGTWKMVQAGSRMLTDAETRYAAIELELLGVCFATRRAELFIKGVKHPVQLRTDHKPLVTIINQKGMHELQNPRIIRMKQHLMPYVLDAQHVPGRYNAVADALSRAPVDKAVVTSIASIRLQVRDEQGHHLRTQQRSERHRELERESMRDEQYCKLRHVLTTGGFPSARNQLDADLRQFWQVKEHLSIHDNLIFMGCRAVIPKTMRQIVLERLHKGHQGIHRTRERARLVVYWPGIDDQIREMIEGCTKCQVYQAQNKKQPMCQYERPQFPGQVWAADLCDVNGTSFLVMTDVYSTWPEVVKLQKTTCNVVKIAMDKVWSRFGLPETLISDGGPQFTGHDLQEFLKQKGIKHVRSAPTYPQSNAFAEAAVKSVKKMLLKAWSFNQGLDEQAFLEGLRQYRNTPSVRDGIAPAQKLLGRPIADELQFRRPEKVQVTKKDVKKYDAKSKVNYDRSSSVLQPLRVGDVVVLWCHRLKRFENMGIISDVRDRRYWIKTKNGVVMRDRRHIRGAKVGQQENLHRDNVKSRTSPEREGGQSQTSWWWSSRHTQPSGPSSSGTPRQSGESTGGGHEERPNRGWANPSHRYTDWAEVAKQRQGGAKAQKATSQEQQQRVQQQTKDRERKGTDHASLLGNAIGGMRHPKSLLSTTPMTNHSKKTLDKSPNPVQAGPNRTRSLSCSRPQRGADASATPKNEPMRSWSGAPRKKLARTRMREEAQRRERQGRRSIHDTRRCLEFEDVDYRAANAESSLWSVTEALKTAFETVRRSARVSRQPDRWRDHM